MSIEIRKGRVEFPSGTGPQHIRAQFVFPHLPHATWVALSGYSAQYDRDDHHIKVLQVQLSTSMLNTDDGPTVEVLVQLLLRDRNGDDPFSGWVEFVLFADTGRPQLATSAMTAGAARWNS